MHLFLPISPTRRVLGMGGLLLAHIAVFALWQVNRQQKTTEADGPRIQWVSIAPRPHQAAPIGARRDAGCKQPGQTSVASAGRRHRSARHA